MAGKEYAHEIGRRLESCASSDERVMFSRLLAATACPDAQAYLLDAITEETDEDAAAAIREALGALEASLGSDST
ncbi:MAG: hypothetical protein ACYC77_11010 [Coriobacteriia bacterium]